MTLQIPPGFGLAAWHFTSTFGTPDFVTTCGVDLGDVGGDFQNAAEALWDYYAGTVMAVTDNALFITKCALHVGQDGGGGTVESTHAPVNGGNSGNNSPVAMAMIGRKITNLAGRKGRGRMFLPGSCGDGDIDQGGHPTPTKMGIWGTALNALHAQMTNGNSNFTISVPPVLLHSGAESPTPIVGFGVSPLVGWVRGRIY